MKFQITINGLSLWQTLSKANLDKFKQLNSKQWESFVKQNENEFANRCSEVGEQLFNKYLDDNNL